MSAPYWKKRKMQQQFSIDDFLTSVAIPMFGFAIVNPMGPTFMGFAIGKSESGSGDLIFFSLNPFSQNAEKISSYSFNPFETSVEAILNEHKVAADIEIFLINNVNHNQSFGTPTILFGVLDCNSDESFDEQRRISFDIVKYSANPRKTLKNLNDFPMNVMERVSHEMSGVTQTIPNADEQCAQISDSEIFEVIEHICNPEHIKQEFKGFNIAWAGAINFQRENGDPDLADSALDHQTALEIIGKLYPSLFQLMIGK